MHLLTTVSSVVMDSSKAIDLQQDPSDIVVLSAADTEISCLAKAYQCLDNAPSLRLASLLRLRHNMSVDLYVDTVVRHAKLVIVRLLGGRSYWPYGVEQTFKICQEYAIPLAFLPGDDQPDLDLLSFSTLPQDTVYRLWSYLVNGGTNNAEQFLRFAGAIIGYRTHWQEPIVLPRAGFYFPGCAAPTLNTLRASWTKGAPVAVLIFYRALVQAGDLTSIDALISALKKRYFNVLPIYVVSLKDKRVYDILVEALSSTFPDIILSCTAFSISAPGADSADSPFSVISAPILQVIFSSENETSWCENSYGLVARDIAMNIALPEVDGRILSRAVSFKNLIKRDVITQCDLTSHLPVLDRINFVAELAASWTRLHRKSKGKRRIALVLANYPNRDGRIGNGVGLDTPASTINILRALYEDGYDVTDIPEDGSALIRRLQAGPTNAHDLTDRVCRTIREKLAENEYLAWFDRLPRAVQRQLSDRWGKPENDPFFRQDRCFDIPAFRCGKVIVGLQPARGYNIDPSATYHDPDLVPPHGYFAFYVWLRKIVGIDAIVHVGKHGNLEWLPGKSVALSTECYPEIALGPLPHFYPFIVNDPGEGAQAKRRTQAVIIDHLIPALTRAESYGPLCDLEHLLDEYYEALSIDPRRLKALRAEILSLCRTTGLDMDCGMTEGDFDNEAFNKLDSYLCELKEWQIKDGLHIFGESPTETLLANFLVALTRLPRADGVGKNASILRSLANDLQLHFDPLNCELNAYWEGPRPEVLLDFSCDTWRTTGNTVERLEHLAVNLVAGCKEPDTHWTAVQAVLDGTVKHLRPIIESCGQKEINGLLHGLDGCHVFPGPSGAPTRGRLDVLPTGRNFYSVDTRAIPTPTSWMLGWKSATLLLERYVQEHGEWPRNLAVTAWGTSNMRTGGDDIAQVLAFMGVRPTWETATHHVTGFEILPQSVLNRPRVDVTLRVSGFFRDAFPGLIDLVDSSARAVAALNESKQDNPLAAHVNAERIELVVQGIEPEEAKRRAGFRVFGSKPGAYGAGLQALIDERGWKTIDDLAHAYIAWGGYAYGTGTPGEAAHSLFKTRLSCVDVIVQNQDNREHDLLDSDDYYQFEGGITAAVQSLSGNRPKVYHADHSKPETPRIRTLEEEISCIVRARAINPKWIAGIMRHGYKGAFEMAATVDYLFAFQATTQCVADHHFDAIFDAYLGNEKVRNFISIKNPHALQEMAHRFHEAIDRKLWRPRRNSVENTLVKLLKI